MTTARHRADSTGTVESSQATWLASLPWYDLREIRWATDAFWREIAQRIAGTGFGEVPRRLNREAAYERQWDAPRFLFGQACGYDVRIAHAHHLRLVATPRYMAPGCVGGTYCSFVVVREDSRYRTLDELFGARCVINSQTSHSGMNILRALVASLHQRGRFFSTVARSGSHELSLAMIRRCEADIAAIDCVTHALLSRHRPRALSGTRILCSTRRVPAPPYVTSASTSREQVAHLRRALADVLDDPRMAEVKDALLIENVDFLTLDSYDDVAALEAVALEQGYREMTAAAECPGC